MDEKQNKRISFFSNENAIDRNSGLELQRKNQERKERNANAIANTEQSKSNLLASAGKAAAGLLFNWAGREIDRTGNNYREQQMTEARSILDKKLAGEREREANEVASAAAKYQVAKEAVDATQNNLAEQNIIDQQNSGVLPVMNVVTGTVGATQQVTKATSGVLGGMSGAKDAVVNNATEVKPATPTEEQAKYSEQLYRGVKAGGQWMSSSNGVGAGGRISIAGTEPLGDAPDNSYVEEARKNLKNEVAIAKENRMKWTSNGNPWLTYFYNQWHGTSDPDVANATAYYQQCNTQFKNESDLYEKVLVNNRQAMEQYMRGKENYFRNATIMLSAASRYGSSSQDVMYMDVFRQQEEVDKATREWQKEQAKVMEERFAKGEALDPNAVPSMITGINQDIVAGNLAAVDGYKFLLRLAANEKSFNRSTQKMMTALRTYNGGRLGNCMSDEAIKTAAIIVNNKRLREMFLQRADMNKAGVELGGQKTGLNYMFTQFGDKDLAVLADAFKQWEIDEANENSLKIQQTGAMQQQYAGLSDSLKNGLLAGLGFNPIVRDALKEGLEQGALPVADQYDTLAKATEEIMGKADAPLMAEVGISKLHGIDYNNMRPSIQDKAANYLLTSNNAAPFNSKQMAEAIQNARTAVNGAFDFFTKLQSGNIDTALIRPKLVQLLQMAQKDEKLGSAFFKDANAVQQAMDLVGKNNEISIDAVKALLSINSEALKQSKPALFIAALNAEPIGYGNGQEDNSGFAVHNLIHNEAGHQLHLLMDSRIPLDPKNIEGTYQTLVALRSNPEMRAALAAEWLKGLERDENAVALLAINREAMTVFADEADARIDAWFDEKLAPFKQQMLQAGAAQQPTVPIVWK